MVDFANCRIPTVERTGMRSQNGLYLPFRGLLGASVDRRRRRLFTMASNPRQPTRSMRRDVVVLGGVLLIAMGSAHAFSLWEEVLGWSQAGDRWDVEELALVSAITLIGFAVFAARRWSELMMTVNALAISERKERRTARYRESFHCGVRPRVDGHGAAIRIRPLPVYEPDSVRHDRDV